MNFDLEQLISLQRLDSAAQDAERRLAEEPGRTRAFEARLENAREQVASAKQRLAANQEARRALEKDAAVHQARLSKFRDQAMEVKTNQEYHAVQKEMAFAQDEIRALEEKILERMIEADELTALLKRGDAELAREQKDVEADRRTMAAELDALKAARERIAADRAAIVASMSRDALATFELVASRRNGVAVAEARDGICTICHVRLRPQVFNTVRRNDGIIQCDSCQRILYFVPVVSHESKDVRI